MAAAAHLTHAPAPSARRAIARELRRRQIAEELDRRLREDTPDLPAFIPQLMRGYVTPWWLAPVMRLYQRAAAGEEVRAVVEAPPRHGKTDLTLAALVWLLAQDTSLVHAFTTYGAHLAHAKSRRARHLARSAGIPLSRERASVDEWRTTSDGGMLATGVDGPLTGYGVTGVGVVDDPFKSRADAESRTVRERVWSWWTDVFSSRIEPGASIIVQGTRWHPDDLVGRLLQEGGWEVVHLPAVAEDEGDALGRAVGDALWPDRWPRDRLDGIRERAGEYTWASLYQQRPQPRGASVFRDAVFYDQLPAGGYSEAMGVDFAYTARTRADYSAAVTGRRYGDDLYLLADGRFKEQVEVPAFLAWLQAQQQQHARRVFTRIGGTEKGVVQLAQAQGVFISAEATVGDKFTNAQSVAARWNAGRVLLPRGAAWVERFLDEVLAFTGADGAHDDDVDALVTVERALFPPSGQPRVRSV